MVLRNSGQKCAITRQKNLILVTPNNALKAKLHVHCQQLRLFLLISNTFYMSTNVLEFCTIS